MDEIKIDETHRDPTRDFGRQAAWTLLLVLALAEALGMSVWMTASSITGQLKELWALSDSQAGWLTSMVQIGFVVGTAVMAVTSIADTVSGKWLFACAAVFAALANLGLLWVPGYFGALSLRFATGFFLAGVYPPAMKMIATWFVHYRGLAIGMIVGALVLGKAAPWGIKAVGQWTAAGTHPDWQVVVVAASVAAAVAGITIGLLWRDGPNPFPRRPFSWSLVLDVVRSQPTRLAIGGYLGHMWELYAMWTWAPLFIAETAAASGVSRTVSAMAAFATIAVGGIGCVIAGWWADRTSRESVVNWSMAFSGAACITIGLVAGFGFTAVVAVALIWGFWVVADSAQFSAMVTEVAPPHAVGTALALQTSLGFLLTVASIQLVPVIKASAGWHWAFALLALGPALGITAIGRMKAIRQSR